MVTAYLHFLSCIYAINAIRRNFAQKTFPKQKKAIQIFFSRKHVECNDLRHMYMNSAYM